jgi:hypothetical protein
MQRPWRIKITPRSFGLRRGTDRDKLIRFDVRIEAADAEAINEGAMALGITRSDAIRAITREAVENGQLITPMGRVRFRDFLPPSEQSPQ